MGDKTPIYGPLLIAFVVQGWRGLSKGQIPPARSFLGLLVITLMLAGVATFSPDIASGFAILTLIAVLFGAFGGTQVA